MNWVNRQKGNNQYLCNGQKQLSILPLVMVLSLASYFLFYFVVISSPVLLSLSTACSPVVLVFCFQPVFPSRSIFPPQLSHISLVSTALFPVSPRLHLISSLDEFVFKPVLSPHTLLVHLFSLPRQSCCNPACIHVSPVLLCLFTGPRAFPVFLICSLWFYSSPSVSVSHL